MGSVGPDARKGKLMFNIRKIVAAVIFMIVAIPAVAQNNSAGLGWSGVWNFPTTSDRQLILNQIDLQQKLENGYYSAIGQQVFNTYYDQSVGEMTITAAEGADVSVDVRTGDNSGNSTTTIGAQNTTMNEINVEGSDNNVTVSSDASSVGCQDGSIQVSSATAGGVDISASASSTTTTSSAITNGASTCN